MKKLYEAIVTSSGGRKGHVKSQDGLIDFAIEMPKELGGKGGALNPELFFAAGYAACFESAVLHVAREKKAPIKDTHVECHVWIGTEDDGGFKLAAHLNVSASGVDQKLLEEIVEQATHVCPYSKATHGNIDFDWKASAR